MLQRHLKNKAMAKKDIILAGVGGQGILSIATVAGWAALALDLHLKQAEVHGMSQRGGDVQSNLRISESKIWSDLIPKGECDLIMSLEPMEALRYRQWLSADGWTVTNTSPFVNIPAYPDMDEVTRELNASGHVVMLDCDAAAAAVGSPKSANMVLLGAAAPLIGIIDPEKLREGIAEVFGRKGTKVVEMNIAAFNAGLEISRNK